MKHIKQLLVLFLAFNVFTSCEKEEETSYVLQDISAPTDINASFNISNDEEGTVTVTPTAEGATEFQIFFGDVENEEPLTVSPGETVTHTYAEGEYNLRIVAVGLTGLTSELVRVVNISFGAPSELDVDIEKSTTNPLEITVAPSAVDATVYDVYFGDAEDEEPTTIMNGESATHIYAEAGDYTVRVVARGGGAATVEYSEVVTVSAASGALKLPITFDDATVNYAVETFNGANFEIVDNPELSGINSEASMVGAITNSGNAFEGITFQMGEAVDFSDDNKTITLKFYSEVAVPLLLKFEGGVNDERQNEVVANHSGSGWEEISFDFATDATTSYINDSDPGGEAFVPTGEYGVMTLFVDGPGTTAGTFYIDDIMKAGGETNTDPFKLPVTFDSETVTYTNSGVAFEIVTNPNQSGINDTDTKVGAVTNAGSDFEAITFTLDEAIDFGGASKTITMQVYSEVAYPVLFKLETGVNGERANEVEVNHGGTGWEELSFDFATDARNSFVQGDDANNGQPFEPTGQYAQFSVFLDFAGPTSGTFYIDDISISTDGGGSNGGGSTGNTMTSFPVDFETPANGGDSANWSVFENADNPPLEIISNPDMMGNSSSFVAKFTAKQGGQAFAGTITQLENPLTLNASNSTVKIMVWKSVISDVGIKFENPEGGSTGEIKVANTKTNEWEELTFDFSGVVGNPNNSNITALVIFPDFQDRMQDNIVYFDNITLNAAGSGGSEGEGDGDGETSEDFSLPVDFGADIEYTTGENSIPFQVVTNPEQSGINATDTRVGEVTNQGGQYEALSFILDEAIDFAGANKTITMKVYSEVAYQVLFKLETGVNGERANEVEVSHAGTGWEELTFDFNNARKSFVNGDDANNGQPFIPTGQYDEVSIFLDFAGFTAGTFYIDDIEQN